MHFDWYNKSNQGNSNIYRPYRDDKTEGYNISPNFFISADVHPLDTLKIARLQPDSEINKKLEKSSHNQYQNRLFDRDTLFLRQLISISYLFYIHMSSTISGRIRNSKRQQG